MFFQGVYSVKVSILSRKTLFFDGINDQSASLPILTVNLRFLCFRKKGANKNGKEEN